MFDRSGRDLSDYNVNNYEFISRTSPLVGGLIKKEYERQQRNVELIASENYCSEAVLAACGSCLSWKYAEGYSNGVSSVLLCLSCVLALISCTLMSKIPFSTALPISDPFA